MSQFHRQNPDYQQTGAAPRDPREAYDNLKDRLKDADCWPQRERADKPGFACTRNCDQTPQGEACPPDCYCKGTPA